MKKYMTKNVSTLLTNEEWIRFSIFPIFTIICIIVLLYQFDFLQNEQQENILITIACGLLIMNVMIFFLINDITKREMQIAESRLINEKIKNETERYQNISKNFESQKKKVHEFNNYISCIRALAQNNEFEKLKDYLDTMQTSIIKSIDLIDTKNIIVNAILNSKYYEAKEKDITFIFKINDLSNIVFEDEDIVVILSNLLNNAFEACEKCNEKIVRMKLIQEETETIISVINSYNKKLVKNGENFETSKSDKEFHGIGIQNIKDTVDKYKGTCIIEYDDYFFKFVISISKNK